jgi:hypothetical protein
MNEFKNPSTKTSDEIKAQLASVNKRMEDRQKVAGYEALARAGFGIMAGTSPHALVNIGQGAPEGFEAYNKSQASTAEDQNLIDKYTIAGQQADEARHQQVGLNLLKIGEMDQASKNALDAKLLALKQTQEWREANQETRNMLAASIIQDKNFKVEAAKNEKGSQIGSALSTYENALNQIKAVRNHPGRYDGMDLTGRAASHVWGTPAYNYNAAVEGLKSAQFMGGIAGIKGTGIGRILLPEVQKIQTATGVLDTKQSREAFDKNLDRLESQILAAKNRALHLGTEYGLSPADFGAQ